MDKHWESGTVPSNFQNIMFTVLLNVAFFGLILALVVQTWFIVSTLGARDYEEYLDLLGLVGWKIMVRSYASGSATRLPLVLCLFILTARMLHIGD